MVKDTMSTNQCDEGKSWTKLKLSWSLKCHKNDASTLSATLLPL